MTLFVLSLFFVRHLILLATLVVAHNSSGQHILSESDSLLIKGFINTKVKLVTAYDYICTASGCPKESEIRRRIEFDQNGHIIRYTTFEFSKMIIDKHRHYEDGLLKKETFFKHDSVLFKTVHYTYDYDQNLIFRTDSSGSGDFQYLEQQQFDKNNNVIFRMTIDKFRDSIETHYRYRYSENGRMLQKTSLTSDQKMIQAIYYEYDSTGNLTQVSTLDPEKGVIPISKMEYQQDKLVKKELYELGKISTTHSFFYEEAQLIKEVVFDHTHDTEYVVKWSYGKHGIKEEIGKYKLDTKLNYKYKTKYNCKGLETKITYFKPNGAVERIIKKDYDKMGNPVKISFSGTEYEYQIIEHSIQYF